MNHVYGNDNFHCLINKSCHYELFKTDAHRAQFQIQGLHIFSAKSCGFRISKYYNIPKNPNSSSDWRLFQPSCWVAFQAMCWCLSNVSYILELFTQSSFVDPMMSFPYWTKITIQSIYTFSSIPPHLFTMGLVSVWSMLPSSATCSTTILQPTSLTSWNQL